jgi:hypothetical protein
VDRDLQINLPQSVHSPDIAVIATIKAERDRAIAQGLQASAQELNTLCGLVAAQANRHATDPRDKVFAMVGLANDINQTNDSFQLITTCL